MGTYHSNATVKWAVSSLGRACLRTLIKCVRDRIICFRHVDITSTATSAVVSSCYLWILASFSDFSRFSVSISSFCCYPFWCRLLKEAVYEYSDILLLKKITTLFIIQLRHDNFNFSSQVILLLTSVQSHKLTSTTSDTAYSVP